MASRVCYGCGLTVDETSRLVVDTGGAVWPYTCDESNGVPIFCGTDNVLRVADSSRTHVRTVQLNSSRDGDTTDATFGSPTPGGGLTEFGTPLTKTINNSNGCRPMTIAVRWGIHHANWNKLGSGDSQTQVGATLSATGSIVDAGADAHQQWRHSGTVTAISLDSMNSTRVKIYTLPAGGSVTFSCQPYIDIPFDNGTTSLQNHQVVLDVEAWD